MCGETGALSHKESAEECVCLYMAVCIGTNIKSMNSPLWSRSGILNTLKNSMSLKNVTELGLMEVDLRTLYVTCTFTCDLYLYTEQLSHVDVVSGSIYVLKREIFKDTQSCTSIFVRTHIDMRSLALYPNLNHQI